MPNIIDIILIVLGVLIVLISAKKGIILTVFDLASGIISFLMAKLLSPYAAEYIYANYVKNTVTAFLSEKYQTASDGIANAVNGAAEFFNFLPKGVLEYAKEAGFLNGDALSSEIMSDITTVQELESNIAAPVITALLQVISFAVIVFVLAVALKIAALFISKCIKKTTVANSLNIALGAVFGVLKGAVYIFIIAAVINVIALSSESMASYAADSYICSFAGKIIGL